MVRAPGPAVGARPSPGAVTTRLFAVLLPAVAFGLGAGVERSRACRLGVGALVGLVAASGVVVVRAGRSAAARDGLADAVGEPPGRPGGGGIRRLIVLIPARDEAQVIGGILGDLAAQDMALLDAPTGGVGGAAPAVQIVVIDDRSRDGTGAAAAAAIAAHGLAGCARVVRRAAGPDGKGAALASVLLPATRDTAILVLDADSRVGPAFVGRCAAALHGGTGIATSRRRMLRPVAGGPLARRLAAAQDDEQLADDALQRARLAMGGAAELRGDGMVIRADVLAELGGWGAGALCEDLDLSARAYLRTGRPVERFPWLEVWEQPVLSPRALVRQRVRWAEGLVRRDLAVVLPAQLDPTIPWRRRLDALAYALHGLAAWVVLGLLLRALAPRAGWARALAAALAAGYLATGAAIAHEALVDPRGSLADTVGRISGALALESLWIVVLPAGWVRAAIWPSAARFARTRHLPTACVAPTEPLA
jgi:hypothetical protein